MSQRVKKAWHLTNRKSPPNATSTKTPHAPFTTTL